MRARDGALTAELIVELEQRLALGPDDPHTALSLGVVLAKLLGGGTTASDTCERPIV